MNMSKNKISLVTGGNRGIGRAVVEGLIKSGVTTILTARDLDIAQQIATDLGGDVVPAQLDVTNAESVNALKDYILNEFGRVDILINNAGIAIDQWVRGLDVEIDRVWATFETNFFGVLRCCQAFVPIMQKTGYGRVVNVSSELGSLETMSLAGTIGYRSSKTAVNALTRLLALEAKDIPNININAACPGWVKTELGGPHAPRTTEEGADTIIWLALLAEDGPSGGLFRDREAYPW